MRSQLIEKRKEPQPENQESHNYPPLKAEAYQIYEKIADNIPGFVFQFVMDKSGYMYFPFISSGLTRLFGVPFELLEESALPALDKVHPDDLEPLKSSIDVSAKNLSIWNQTFRIVCLNTRITWIQGIATPERNKDLVIWHGLIYDVTEKKNSEELLAKQQKQLDEIAFIQVHEFRRPIANMLGIFDILSFESKSHKMTAKQMAHWLNLMKKSVKETDDIIAKIVTKATE